MVPFAQSMVSSVCCLLFFFLHFFNFFVWVGDKSVSKKQFCFSLSAAAYAEK